ncbi:hypothetical protein LTR66_001785 [Elasticomyces elasticus]|nr:hypothetical protein LTR66_001785 [Elasticomyces elasticus]
MANSVDLNDGVTAHQAVDNPLHRPNTFSLSHASESSQTAQEFIASQLQLEADAREALPYQFDACSRPLGPLRQSLFSCLTCNPPPSSTTEPYTPAGICYSCSIACHGEHDLVELFAKRNFVCDCGTTRITKDTPCTLRLNEETGQRGVKSEAAAPGNRYDHNYAGRFCACEDVYDPTKEKGTMFQCLGLGTVEEGGCGEDWWHPECLVGISRTWWREDVESNANRAIDNHTVTNSGLIASSVASEPVAANGSAGDVHGLPEGGANAGSLNDAEPPLPPGFPPEDDFDQFICYKCVFANPWIKAYAGTPGFLPAVYHKSSAFASLPDPAGGANISIGSKKRKLAELEDDDQDSMPEGVGSRKRSRSTSAGVLTTDPGGDVSHSMNTNALKGSTQSEAIEANTAELAPSKLLHEKLPPASTETLSLFLKEDFRDHLCRCSSCFPHLSTFPQLLEEEETYEPPVSESDPGDGQGSVGTGSLLERGEAALSNIDRVRAIEGVMAYNHVKEKVKSFLQPFAESGKAVGAEDIKSYFAKLRGDEEAIKAAAAGAEEGSGASGDGRREQGGY